MEFNAQKYLVENFGYEMAVSAARKYLENRKYHSVENDNSHCLVSSKDCIAIIGENSLLDTPEKCQNAVRFFWPTEFSKWQNKQKGCMKVQAEDETNNPETPNDPCCVYKPQFVYVNDPDTNASMYEIKKYFNDLLTTDNGQKRWDGQAITDSIKSLLDEVIRVKEMAHTSGEKFRPYYDFLSDAIQDNKKALEDLQKRLTPPRKAQDI